jgi:hypothetical protein
VLEDIPKPSELCRVSGRNGASSGTMWTSQKGCTTFEL